MCLIFANRKKLAYILISLYSTMLSYRRFSMPSYSSQFKWTYGLKLDVFRCYKKAKSDPRIGYMKRMKILWDNIHPELNHFSVENIE